MNYIIIAFIGIIGAFYYNTFKWLIESWMHNAYYSHGFLVPIISIYIIWRMRKELIDTNKKEYPKGLIVFVSGLMLQGIAIIYVMRFLSGLSFITTVFGILLYMYGKEFVNRIKFPILFLLFAIPLPFIDIVAPPAQTISAIESSNLANFIGIPVRLDGLLLNTPKGSFEVALECSGLRSILSLLTLSVIYSFMLEGSFLMKSTIVLSSLPLAMIGNILRITSVLMIANIYGKDVAINYFHDFSSILLFGASLIGLFLIGRLFGRLKFKNL